MRRISHSRGSRLIICCALTVGLVAAATPTAYATPGRTPHFSPGAPGTGDPYFPDMGNGGYDVSHYDIRLAFDPTTKAINATTKIPARATQDLSRFDLDFQGPLTISRLSVDGRRAAFTRSGAQELVITPRHGLRKGRPFIVSVTYAGVPQKIDDPALGVSGWAATKDGAVALNQPIGAATYYPVNDTPTDKATYTQTVTVPTRTHRAGQRRTRAHHHPRRPDHLPLAHEPADGQRAEHDRDRQVQRHPRRDRRRPAEHHRDRHVDRHQARSGQGVQPDHRTDHRMGVVDCTGATRSTRPAASSPTSASGTPWRRRAGRSTTRPPATSTATCSPTSSATSGSATASPRCAGRTSGSTKASPPTRSGSTRRSSTASRCDRPSRRPTPTRRTGPARSPTPAATTSSTTWSTPAAR